MTQHGNVGVGPAGVEDRPRLRAGAAGAVAGFGAACLLQYVTAVGWSSALAAASDVPFLLLALSLVYGGYWLLRSEFCTDRVGRIAVWSVVGFLGLVGVALWLVPSGSTTLHGAVLLTVDAGTVGASTGLLVGLENERRSGGVGAADPRLAARQAEARFDFFNDLLRHHVLNGVAVVKGHAELLVETREDPPAEAAVIRERSAELADLVRNVDALGRAYSGELGTRPVDPEPALMAAVEGVRRDRPGAEIRTDLRPVSTVVANDRIGTAFGALLRVAVGSAEDGPVAVSMAQEGDEVVVVFSYDGALPDRLVADADPWAYGEGDLGLFLAETLVGYFGGSFAESADRGFSVRLPAAA